MNTIEHCNACIRNINNCVRRRNLILQGGELGELGRKPKLSKEQKRELKRLAKIEKKERKRLLKLLSKKERKVIKKRTEQAQRDLKKSGGAGFIKELNGPLQFPLSAEAEKFRVASLAGDFETMNSLAPYGHANWTNKTSLGKYRFKIENGKPVYVPWSDFEIQNFLAGPWAHLNPQTGMSPLIHPNRSKGISPGNVAEKWIKGQAKAARKFAPSDPRHVFAIEPGQYIYGKAKKSTLKKIAGPALAAIGIVAAVYLGPAALSAIRTGASGLVSGITGGGAATATTATTAAAGTAGAAATVGGALAAIPAGASTLVNYVNNARTIKAVVNGKMPPPPISIQGDSFGEWAFIVARDKMIEDYGRKLTKQEEDKLRREIADMQNELVAVIPNDVLRLPPQPDSSLAGPMQKIQQIEIKRNDDLQQFLIPAALVVGALLIGA